MIYEVVIDGTKHRLELTRDDARWTCKLDDEPLDLDAVLARQNVVSVIINGACYEVKREQTPLDLHIWVKNVRFKAEVSDPRSLRSRRAAAGAALGPAKLVAPMPGRVVRIVTPEKSAIEAGKGVLVIEAMKMQNELKAPKAGVVQKILVSEGMAVNAGDVLAIVE